MSPSRANVLVAGTLDTKSTELRYMRDILAEQDFMVQLVDLSTSGEYSRADIDARQIATCHPLGCCAVFTGDRGESVAAMALAFESWIRCQTDILGIIGAGGSGGTAMLAPAMRALPFGVPKVLISTVASGEVSQYVGPADILMLHSVADVQGLNSITRKVLANGASALAGMVRYRTSKPDSTIKHPEQPALGLSMFGVTTSCVQQLVAKLESSYECLVFHATGIGGQSMESLIDNGLISSVLDITTTEVCDMHMGGVFSATEDRFGAVIRTRIPFVGACGALDMVNFGARHTVPECYRNRNLYAHNPQVTLMRTTAEENTEMGRWIGNRLNQMQGQVRFLIPTGGFSALDAPGMAFYDPLADEALTDALESTVRQGASRKLIRSAHHINDTAFVAEVLAAFDEVNRISQTDSTGGH